MEDPLNIFTVSPRAVRMIDMLCIIAQNKGPIVAREIERKSGLDSAEVHDYAARLKGLLTSVRGRDGGYVISKHNLTIGDVLTALKEFTPYKNDMHIGRLATAMNRLSRIKIEDLIEED